MNEDHDERIKRIEKAILYLSFKLAGLFGRNSMAFERDVKSILEFGVIDDDLRQGRSAGKEYTRNQNLPLRY